MLDTLTRLYSAIFASLSAISKLVSFSLCLPTPFVINASFGSSNSGVPPLNKSVILYYRITIVNNSENFTDWRRHGTIFSRKSELLALHAESRYLIIIPLLYPIE